MRQLIQELHDLNEAKAKKKKKLSKRALEKAINQAYKIHGNRVQVPMLKLGAIFKEVEAAYHAGDDIDDAMKAAISKYRV